MTTIFPDRRHLCRLLRLAPALLVPRLRLALARLSSLWPKHRSPSKRKGHPMKIATRDGTQIHSSEVQHIALFVGAAFDIWRW